MAKRSKPRKATAADVPVVATGSDITSPQKLSSLIILRDWKFWLKVLTIIGAILWVYSPVFHGDWLWDDNYLITDNRLVHDPWGLWKIWFKPGDLIDYTPLTVTVEWIEWHVWEMNTLGYHLVNLALHLTSALLIWRLLAKFGLKFAWLGGLLFVVHPVIVESVAWIAELKNTLSLPPFLLAMCAFIDYEKSGNAKYYRYALGLFLVAMLCKATMVMFPLVILLYAWWRRGKITISDLRASVPFFLISLVIGVTTTWFLQHHAMGREMPHLGGPLERLACAGLALAFYFGKCVLPIGMSPTYPQWEVNSPTLIQFLPWPVLIGALAWLWTKRSGWGRHALLGLGFFAINLLPFLGFTPGSYMIFTWVMDHILYIPLIGLVGLFVAGVGQLQGMIPRTEQRIGSGLLVLVAGLLAWGSHLHAQHFINEETLWRDAVAKNPACWKGYNNIGIALTKKGKMDQAIPYYQKSLEINPSNLDALVNLGNVFLLSGRVDEAIGQFNLALKLNPNITSVHINLGNALSQKGQTDAAMVQYENALKIDPNLGAAHNNLGNALLKIGRTDEAIVELQKALAISPNVADTHYNLGLAFLRKRMATEAIAEFQHVLQLSPDDRAAQDHLAQAQALERQSEGRK